jgi:hypothetical protein
MKIKYSTLKDPMFISGMAKVNRCPFPKTRLSYNVSRIVDKVQQEAKRAQDIWIKLVKQYAKMDEKGEFISPEDKPGCYEIPDEKQEEFKVKVEEFENFEFDIDRYPLKLDDLNGSGLSPQEIHTMECVLDVSEASDGPKLVGLND